MSNKFHHIGMSPDAKLPMVYALPKIQSGKRNNRIYQSYAGKGGVNETLGQEGALRNTL